MQAEDETLQVRRDSYHGDALRQMKAAYWMTQFATIASLVAILVLLHGQQFRSGVVAGGSVAAVGIAFAAYTTGPSTARWSPLPSCVPRHSPI